MSGAIGSHGVNGLALSSLFRNIWDKFDNLLTRSISLLWIRLITISAYFSSFFTDDGIISSSEAPRLLLNNLMLSQLMERLNTALTQVTCTWTKRAHAISITAIDSCTNALSVWSTLSVVGCWSFQCNLGRLNCLRCTCGVSNCCQGFDQSLRCVPTTLSIVTWSTTSLFVLQWQSQISEELRLWLPFLSKLLSVTWRRCILKGICFNSGLVLVLCTACISVENASRRSLIVMINTWERVRLGRPTNSSRLLNVLRSGHFRKAGRLMMSIFSILRERLCNWSLLTAGPYLALADRGAGGWRDSAICGTLLSCIQTVWNSNIPLLLQITVESPCRHTLLRDWCIICVLIS